ncbi:MAG: site-specific integrase [Chloroflexi bacterium]|nr:site-specific integrase [Chloroflexota bacterium]
MPRRVKGEGSIRQRKDGRWTGQYYEYGKRRSVYGNSLKEVSGKLAQERRRVEVGNNASIGPLTLEVLFQHWLQLKTNTIKESTLNNYDQRIRVNVLPTLGMRQASRINQRDLSTLYDRLIDGGQSPQTVQHVHRVVHNMFRDAERQGWLNTNPAALVKAPQPAPKNWTILTQDQLAIFWDKSALTTYGALWALLSTTGMRVGEALALQWTNIDSVSETIRVERTLAWTRGSWRLEEPKTAAAIRTVHMDKATADLLSKWRETQNKWKSKSPVWMTEHFVFTNQIGKPMYSTNLLRNHFRPILKDLDIPVEMRIHDLRHTYATLALQAGANPSDVAGSMGHSSVRTTLTIYAHTLPGASLRISRLLGRSK